MNTKIYIAIFTSFMFLATGCDNDKLLEINEDPNAALEINFDFMLAQGMLEVSSQRYDNWRGNLIYSSTMIQHIAHLGGYWSGDKYLLNEGYSAALWDRYYPNTLETLTHIVDKTRDDPDKVNTYAIALLLRTFSLHRLTDVYGDIPYSQAGKGLEGQEFWFPAYDSQQDVYSFIVRDLKEAREALSASGNDLGNQDLIYGGDLDKWKRMANSLLIRVGMRMSNVDASTAQSVVEEAANHPAGTFTSNDDNFMIVHEDGQGINRNGISEVFLTGGETHQARPSATFVDWMMSLDDPRLMIISGGVGDPRQDASTWNTDSASQVGLPNGFDSQTIVARAISDGLIGENDAFDQNNIYSFINPKLYNFEDPMFFQTYAEVELLLAEALLKGWSVPGNIGDHFTNGVTGALNMWVAFDGSFAVDPADVTAYIDGLGFGAATPADQERLIGEQYWASTFFNHYESWANWRRTGFPVLVPTNYNGNVTGGTIPRRLAYPVNEAGSNPANYAAAIARQGEDVLTTRMWWDVN